MASGESGALPDSVTVDNDVGAGELGAIVEQHGRLYRAEYDLDARFEAYVAKGIADVVLSPTEPTARFWIVRRDGRFAGGAAVCTTTDGSAQFRWFLLEPDLRGLGLGRRLLREAVDHCRAAAYDKVFLWTIDALEAAAHLYREVGFTESERHHRSPWGPPVVEVRYDLSL